MIDLWYRDEERSRRRPFGRDGFVAHLEAAGLLVRRAQPPLASGIVLMFAPLEGSEVASLSMDIRTRVVLVAEGEAPAPTEAEAAREAAGLLGLIEPDAWSKWNRGLFVAWGFYGRADIATAAGLAPLDMQGLQPVEDREALPEVTARFLRAAEEDLGATTSPGR